MSQVNAELSVLRDLLYKLQSGQMKMLLGAEDVTEREVEILDHEITRLEGILSAIGNTD
jgi:hypothetical protein